MIATLFKAPWMRDEPKLVKCLLHLALAVSSIKILPIHVRKLKASSLLRPGRISKECRSYGYHFGNSQKGVSSSVWLAFIDFRHLAMANDRRVDQVYWLLKHAAVCKIVETMPKTADVCDHSIRPKTSCGVEMTCWTVRRSKTQSSLHLELKSFCRAATPAIVNVGPLAEGLSCAKTRLVEFHGR